MKSRVVINTTFKNFFKKPAFSVLTLNENNSRYFHNIYQLNLFNMKCLHISYIFWKEHTLVVHPLFALSCVCNYWITKSKVTIRGRILSTLGTRREPAFFFWKIFLRFLFYLIMFFKNFPEKTDPKNLEIRHCLYLRNLRGFVSVALHDTSSLSAITLLTIVFDQWARGKLRWSDILPQEVSDANIRAS